MKNEAPTPLEERLRAAGRNLAYPPTPAHVPGLKPGAGWAGARWPGALAALAVILIITLAAVPQVRAAVLEFIQVGAVRIFGDPDALPVAEATPAAIPDLEGLFGRTTPAEAASRLGFPLEVPAALGDPDAVYVQRRAGDLAFLVWLDAGQVETTLTVLGPGAFAWKAPLEPAAEVQVGGARAVWIEGPHPFYLQTASGGDREVLLFEAGSVLIWEEDGLTYRLEGRFTLEEAIRIAESIGASQR